MRIHKKINPEIAVVITTYNNPKSLELCLLSLTNQTFKNFEVFIADDGSDDETRELISKFKRDHEFLRVYHIWHPDEGYRKAKINNKAFAQIDPEKFPIIVCIDHDVVLHHRFIEDHFKVHEKEKFEPLIFMGRRIDLGEQLSNSITTDNVLRFNQGMSLSLLWSGLKGETKNVMRSIRMDLPKPISLLLKRERTLDLLGSNFSISTSVLLDVNGYNEDFKSYWGEDGDLYVRVRNSGIKMIGKVGYAVQWHLYHKRLIETPDHVAMYRALLENHEYRRCSNGIKKA
jgi:glycosyltransferase involved in cell wall biosynthesis